MNSCRKLFLMSFVSITSLLLYAQQPDSSLLTLDRLYGSREFSPESFGPTRWVDGGSGYTTLEPSRELKRGRDIVRYATESGSREILVPAARLVPPGDSTALSIQGYEWSADGKKLLVFTNTRRVWRQNTRGDYWVVNLKTWKMEKLGGDAPTSTLMFAKFSPDGESVGYVRAGDLYVEDLATHRITRLTNDGSSTRTNGTFDWVYEEEFSDRDGFRWSPDSKCIAYWQLDAEKVPVFHMINNTDSLYPVVTSIRYPKAGEPNSICRVGVVSAAGGPTRWMNVPGDPSDNYIPWMEWASNSTQLILQHLNRLQNTNDVMLGDVRNGEVHTVFTDKDSTWVEVVEDIHWLEGGKSFLWESERDGWKHVYRVARDGKKVKLITPGEFDVIKIEAVDEQSGWLYVLASPDDPLRRSLFRTRLTGDGTMERITPVPQKGSHDYNIAPDAKWAIHTYSTIDSPPIIELVSIPSCQVIRTFVDNARLRAKVRALKRSSTEFFRVDIGGVQLDGMLMKPFDFDPAKRYPVLFHVYGEPAAQTVVDRWGGTEGLWHTMMTQKGYVIVSVDNRGTPAPRGRSWRRCIYRQIGILASADQAAAARMIGRWNFVDSTRMGIWGWSGGGSMSLNAIFRYPEIYTTAVAVASVPNQRYYDTIYQERYMGLPKDNPVGYRDGSPITFADRLRGNLLLIHGSGDDNVHYQGAEALVNALVAANKPFTMMEYPNRSHGIYEGKNTSLHLFNLITRYLTTNLPPASGPH